MIDLGRHAIFIISSYVGVAIVIGALILWVWTNSNRQKKRLTDLEKRGISRRSEN